MSRDRCSRHMNYCNRYQIFPFPTPQSPKNQRPQSVNSHKVCILEMENTMGSCWQRAHAVEKGGQRMEGNSVCSLYGAVLQVFVVVVLRTS